MCPGDNKRLTMALSDNKEIVQNMRSIDDIKENDHVPRVKVSIKPLN